MENGLYNIKVGLSNGDLKGLNNGRSFSFNFTSNYAKRFWKALLKENRGNIRNGLYGLNNFQLQKAIDDFMRDFDSLVMPITEVYAMYLFIGGTDSTHKINAANPGFNDLTFVATTAASHTSTGTKFNGTTQYAKTGLIASRNLIPTSHTLSALVSAGTNTGSSRTLIGNSDGTNNNVSRLIWNAGTALYRFISLANVLNGLVECTTSNINGFYTGTRFASNDFRVFKEGVQEGSKTTTSGSLFSQDYYIGCDNSNGTAGSFSNCNFKFVLISKAIPIGKMTIYTTLVNNLQTSLGR